MKIKFMKQSRHMVLPALILLGLVCLFSISRYPDKPTSRQESNAKLSGVSNQSSQQKQQDEAESYRGHMNKQETMPKDSIAKIESTETAASSVPMNGNQEVNNEFMNAAFWGKTEQVIKLLPYVNQNAKEEGLIDASGRGYLPIVQAILANGVHIDPINENYDTPLRNAAANGNDHIVTFLISKGANVNYQGEDMWTPLMFAAYNGNIQSVRILLAHGANAKIKDYNGSTALALAAKNGHNEIITLLTKSW